MSPAVELVVAWEWDCPTCAAANFARAVDVEIPPDDPELQFLADQTGGAGLCVTPASVKCQGCGVRWPVKIDSPPEETDDDSESWKRT